MTDVGILPLDPHSCNYGGVLQTVALQDAVKDLGMRCEIIQYSRWNEHGTFSPKRGLRYLTADKVFSRFYDMYNAHSTLDTQSDYTETYSVRFRKFWQEHLILSERIDAKTLREKRLPYDALICGSDQIWNPDYNIPAFFLDFAHPDQKRIIYAASIGKDRLTNLQKTIYQSYLRDLDDISVREESAQKMISKISGKPVHLVLDPTLLHTKEYWMEKMSDEPLETSRYIFCYFLEFTKEKTEAAREFAQAHKCKVVIIPFLHGKKEKYSDICADESVQDASPADFLRLIYDAEFVLTDSFHATVFSLIFRKQFWVFGRGKGKQNMNTRIDTLLGYFHLSARMISPSALSEQSDRIVYSEEDCLEEARRESLQFLKKALV